MRNGHFALVSDADEEDATTDYPLRATFNALRYMVRAGCPWGMMPNDLPLV
jgi:transposase